MPVDYWRKRFQQNSIRGLVVPTTVSLPMSAISDRDSIALLLLFLSPSCRAKACQPSHLQGWPWIVVNHHSGHGHTDAQAIIAMDWCDVESMRQLCFLWPTTLIDSSLGLVGSYRLQPGTWIGSLQSYIMTGMRHSDCQETLSSHPRYFVQSTLS